MTTKQQFIYKYKTASILEKLIGLNIIMFVLSLIVGAIIEISGGSLNPLVDWLVFPDNLSAFIYKPWTIISYAFMHANFIHILFNMIILNFGGRLFLTYYSQKRLLNYYLLGAIFGALIFMLSYTLFPSLSNGTPNVLIGASAAVLAVFIGVATKVPNAEVRLLLIGNIKLKWIAAIFLVLNIVQIGEGNYGGVLSHLGGAFIGYMYTKQLDKGNDIGKWIENIITAISNFFVSKPKPKKASKVKMKTVYKNKKTNTTTTKTQISKSEKQKQIDEILDKISKSGYESLSKQEKDFLFNAGKDL